MDNVPDKTRRKAELLMEVPLPFRQNIPNALLLSGDFPVNPLVDKGTKFDV